MNLEVKMKYDAILRLEIKKYTQQKVADELGIKKETVSKWMEETKQLITKKAIEE